MDILLAIMLSSAMTLGGLFAAGLAVAALRTGIRRWLSVPILVASLGSVAVCLAPLFRGILSETQVGYIRPWNPALALHTLQPVQFALIVVAVYGWELEPLGLDRRRIAPLALAYYGIVAILGFAFGIIRWAPP